MSEGTETLLDILPAYLLFRRKELKRSQKKAGEVSSINYSEYSKVEKGHRSNLKASTIEKLLLGVDSNLGMMYEWHNSRTHQNQTK